MRLPHSQAASGFSDPLVERLIQEDTTVYPPQTLQLTVSVPMFVATVRKPRDTTKLTQYMYDFICFARQQWEQYNAQCERGCDKKSLQDLADVINQRMNTDKSVRALARVWAGQVDRDMLPAGKPYFHY